MAKPEKLKLVYSRGSTRVDPVGSKQPESNFLIEATTLADRLDDPRLLIVDLSMPAAYQEGHVPGAVHLHYPSILYAHDEVGCDIPPDAQLRDALERIGLQPDDHVVAYDRQGCAMAARLCWTLEAIGHKQYALLNGGWKAWANAGLAADQSVHTRTVSSYPVRRSGRALASKDYILSKLNNPDTVIVDTRSEEEFTNELPTTDRSGNIPGAVHFNWEDALDEENDQRLLPPERILPMLWEKGITTDKEIITYCQTHFRSAHTYMLLRILGYTRVLGYAAGYSEWGNDPDVPIENEMQDED